MSNTNCSVCKGTGVYVPGNLKTCPRCHPDEQETIYDRDLRAIVAGYVSDPGNTIVVDARSIQNILRVCNAIASEMQKQRKERKASNNE